MANKKDYVDLVDFRLDSYKLAAAVLVSGFRPDFMVALWRGGAIPGICMHETFKWAGLHTDHIAIRTSKYTGIDQANATVQVHNLGYLCSQLTPESKVLLVDDIFDSGHSIDAVLDALRERLQGAMPRDVQVATVYYKPSRHTYGQPPDYFIHKTDAWVVFPHEVEGMSLDEIETSKGSEVSAIFSAIQRLE